MWRELCGLSVTPRDCDRFSGGREAAADDAAVDADAAATDEAVEDVDEAVGDKEDAAVGDNDEAADGVVEEEDGERGESAVVDVGGGGAEWGGLGLPDPPRPSSPPRHQYDNMLIMRVDMLIWARLENGKIA